MCKIHAIAAMGNVGLTELVPVHAGHANGSSDRLVANMDQQAREVEEGVSAALAHSLPLLTVVIRDAATSSETISPVSLFVAD